MPQYEVTRLGSPQMGDLFYSRAVMALTKRAKKEGWMYSHPSRQRSEVLTLTCNEGDEVMWSRDYVCLVPGAGAPYVFRIEYIDGDKDRLKWMNRAPKPLLEYLNET